MKKLILLFLILSFGQTAITQFNHPPAARHNFIVIAHRGDHVIFPENTLAAYKEAIRNEVDYIEIDLRTTKDGKLVSMHDATVNRMTDGKGLVSDMTLDEITQLKIRNKDSLDKQIYRVPTFEQILTLCKNNIYIYIDFKQAGATETYALLKKYGMENQVLVYINSPQQFTDWRKTMPGMPLMVSKPGNITDSDGLSAFIDQYKPDLLDGGWKEYTAEMLTRAKAIQLPVWPDIQGRDEGIEDWSKAIDKGFTGLQTDHPALLIKFLKEKGLRK